MHLLSENLALIWFWGSLGGKIRGEPWKQSLSTRGILVTTLSPQQQQGHGPWYIYHTCASTTLDTHNTLPTSSQGSITSLNFNIDFGKQQWRVGGCIYYLMSPNCAPQIHSCKILDHFQEISLLMWLGNLVLKLSKHKNSNQTASKDVWGAFRQWRECQIVSLRCHIFLSGGSIGWPKTVTQFSEVKKIHTTIS